jgi:uncharacterized protein YycO
MSYQPRPGDYGVVHTSGFFGKLIRLGTMSRWNHAFIYIGDGKIVEANPSGVAVSPLGKYPAYYVAWNQHEELSDDQRKRIVEHALSMVGDSYGFVDIANLAFRILGLKVIANTKVFCRASQRFGVICSELVAECYKCAKIDFGVSYSVTPGDLAYRLVYQ